ncbi:hypothetical protein DXG01_011442, partial [Tephrocybe rancida]
SIGWEFPTHVPFDATKDYILGFTRLWNQPALSCFQDVFTRSSEFITTLMTSHFGQFKNLEKHATSVVHAELEKRKVETTKALTKMLKLEVDPVFTQNTELMQSERIHWLQQFYNAQYPVNAPMSVNARTDVYRKHADYDALSVMADVRAYFQVAHKRLIDYVPLTVEHTLNQTLAGALQRSLFKSFLEHDGSGTDQDTMAALLIEDPVIAKRRVFLQDRKKRLLLIKERLDLFGQALED